MISALILCAFIVNASLLTRPVTAMELQQVSDTKAVSPKQDTGDSDESARYIVILQSDPICKTLKEIRSSKMMATPDRASRIGSHLQSLSDEQDQVIESIRRNSWALEIRGRMRTILNGFVIKARPSKLRYIESMPQVKAVYPSRPVWITLSSSVPSIGAPTVWSMVDGSGNPVTGQGIRVGIIDSGIDYTHPALGGCFGTGCKVAGGYDFVNGDANPMDDSGHGTHVAGIVAANDTTYMGVAKDATLFAYKVVNEDGVGQVADIILALEAAADPDGNPLTDDHLDVITMSLAYRWGGPGGKLSQEVDRHVTEVGMVIAQAAGNGGPGYDTVLDPGYSEAAMTVGASDNTGHVSSFSSRGYYGRIKPDVLAPGDSIVSTALGGGWTSKSGTSMATPHVAGAAALLKQLDPDLTPDQIKARLMNTALTQGHDPFAEGAGRIRADQAATVEMIFQPGSLMLGSVDYGKATWSSIGKFNLVNASSSTRNYQLNIGTLKGSVNSSGNVFDAVPAGYQATLVPTAVTLAPGESKEVNFTIVVHTGVLQPPAESPFAYFSSISASDGMQEILLPFAFLYAPHPLRQLDGWPIWVDDGYSPLIADLDNDGDMEVVCPSSDSISVFHHDGTLLEGWPQPTYSSVHEIPVIGDLDGDGDLEIFISNIYLRTPWGTQYALRALHHDGSDVVGWPKVFDEDPHFVLLANLDADRLPEVVVYLVNSRMSAFDGNGMPLPGWPVITNYVTNNMVPPIAVDLDGDGDTEIIKATSVYGMNDVYAFHHTGKPVAGWPASFESAAAAYASPAAGDIDNDGDMEVIVTTGSGKVYAWHYDATPVAGWPVTAATVIKSGPALADLDNDGDLEIVITTSAKTIYAYHHNGTLVSGWPVITPEWSNGNPVIGDIDGDGDQEIVFCSSSPLEGGKLAAYHHNGRVVKGFPLEIAAHFYGNPVLGDLDQDGDMEILVASIDYFNESTFSWEAGKLYAFDLTGSYKPSNIDWGSWRHDLWGTSSFGFLLPRPSRPPSFDYDGDGMADIAVWRPDSGVWYMLPSKSPGNYSSTKWGMESDTSRY